jgi:outer membrane protein assembly factor BamE
MKKLLIYTFSLIILGTAGCSKDKIPGVYRIDIQQGNDVTQDMLNKLEPGMTKNQVAYVMGTPLIIDTFHPDRWDYVYTFSPGNGQREQRRITAYFVEDRLSYIDGDLNVVPKEDLPEVDRTGSNVVVPLTKPSEGLIDDLKRSMGLNKDESPEQQPTEDAEPQSVPEPKQNSDLFDGLSGTNETDSQLEQDQQETHADNESEPGLFARFKNSIGLGE